MPERLLEFYIYPLGTEDCIEKYILITKCKTKFILT